MASSKPSTPRTGRIFFVSKPGTEARPSEDSLSIEPLPVYHEFLVRLIGPCRHRTSSREVHAGRKNRGETCTLNDPSAHNAGGHAQSLSSEVTHATAMRDVVGEHV